MCGKPAGHVQLQHGDSQLCPTSHHPSARTRIRRDVDGIRAAGRGRRSQQPGHCL